MHSFKYLYSIFNPKAQLVGVQCFCLHLFHHVLVFSGLRFCSCVIGFLLCLFFTTKVSAICTHSLDPLFLTPGKFQAWDWLWYPLTCGPRGRVGVGTEQKSRSALAGV